MSIDSNETDRWIQKLDTDTRWPWTSSGDQFAASAWQRSLFFLVNRWKAPLHAENKSQLGLIQLNCWIDAHAIAFLLPTTEERGPSVRFVPLNQRRREGVFREEYGSMEVRTEVVWARKGGNLRNVGGNPRHVDASKKTGYGMEQCLPNCPGDCYGRA